MSWMIEAYVPEHDGERAEENVRAIATAAGGIQTFREAATPGTPRRGVCLTLEFTELAAADAVANKLRSAGIHIEGPYDY